MIELMFEVFLVGVVNCVIGLDSSGLNIGGVMFVYGGICKIVFIGFCGIGEKVMEFVVFMMKCLMLELGGNDVGIVLGDVDVEVIVSGLFWGIFINNG